MLQLGVQSFLKKDVHPAELNYALDSIISHGYFYPQSVSGRIATMFHKASNKKSMKDSVVFTENEMKFLKWVGTDLPYKRIAEEMCVSERTIENYRASLCDKLALRNRMDLAIFAMKNGIIPF